MFKRLLTGLVLVALGIPLQGNAQATGSPPPRQAPPVAGLLPGDVIRLQIWREPDLSGEYQVDETGVVVFPRLGDIRVTGETPAGLEELLQNEYRRYLRNPSIEVTVLRRINVLGAVQRAGLYTVDPTATIADVLALAGGTTNVGDQNRIQIIRGNDVVTSSLSPGSRVLDLAILSGDQIFVPERSWFSRNSGVVAAGITASVSLIIALFVR